MRHDTLLIVLALCLIANLVYGKSLRDDSQTNIEIVEVPNIYQITQNDLANVLFTVLNKYQSTCNKPGVKLVTVLSTTSQGTTTGATYKFVFSAQNSSNQTLPNLTVNAKHNMPNSKGVITVQFSCS